jgi:hypothetical protein
MLRLEMAEEICRGIDKKPRRKVKVIGLGSAGFWAFIGFVSGYLLAAMVAAPIWNR